MRVIFFPWRMAPWEQCTKGVIPHAVQDKQERKVDMVKQFNSTSQSGKSIYRKFSLPVRQNLDEPRRLRCNHCDTVFTVDHGTEFCWPDRIGTPRWGLVILCPKCGCRQVLPPSPPKPVSESKNQNDSSTDKSDTGKKISWPAVLLALVLLITALVVYYQLMNSEPLPFLPRLHKLFSVAMGEDASDSRSGIRPVKEWGEKGNLHINISEGGFMLPVGDRVYYTNPRDNYCIYSMNLQFQDMRKEGDIPCFYLSYRDGFLYFSGARKGKQHLYRMDLDSGNEYPLVQRNIYEPKLAGDSIYFDDVDEHYSLYRCNLDGTDVQKIASASAYYTCIENGKVYYLDIEDSYHLYCVNLDGSGKEVLLEENFRELSVQGDTLYLSRRRGGVLTYSLSSGEIQQISELSVSSLVAADDGWLYFSNRVNQNYLYKMSWEGESVTKLSEEPAALINVVSNLISFKSENTDQFYWILTDGSCCQEVF